MRSKTISIIILLSLVMSFSASAQDDLAAILEVLEGEVQVQRVGTSNPLPVSVEAIVGVGDTVFTNETGRARITFFADGIETEVLPNTVYRIDAFNGNDEEFNISIEVLLGETLQQIERALGANSSYEINTPSMTLAARGTIFDVRVEDTGRAAMLVHEGLVEADAEMKDDSVDAGFGIRSTNNGGLSDVVRADHFDQLDSALDGCSVSINVADGTNDDISLNIRSGPSRDLPILGYIIPADVTLSLGTIEGGGWYRIQSSDGFGWVSVSDLVVDSNCSGLRVFASDFVEETSSVESSN